MSYATQQCTDSGGYFVFDKDTRRILGAVGNDHTRAWVYPLLTPRGISVTQESPFDHPFHQGIFVGQGKVLARGRVANFWSPYYDFRQPNNPMYQHLGTLRYAEPPEVAESPNGYTFTYKTVWLDAEGEPLLDERRVIRLYEGGDATLCELESTKSSSYVDVVYAANKHGSIGARVQPQLLPAFGGFVLALTDGHLARGSADEVAHGKACDVVAYEADIPVLGAAGLALKVLTNSHSPNRRGPWFVRDYGLVMFNPTMDSDVAVPRGDSWTTSLRVAAYDGSLTPERSRVWFGDHD